MFIIESLEVESGEINGPSGMQFWDGGLFRRARERAMPFPTKGEANAHAAERKLRRYRIVPQVAA